MTTIHNRAYARRGSACAPQAGSILILVLFMCLAAAVVVHGLCAVVFCAERSVIDESVGRQRLEEKDQGLATLRQRALTTWEPSPWAVVWERAAGRASVGPVEGALSELQGDVGWVMEARVRQGPTVSGLTSAAWVERGRDGIDLPLAALVAETVVAAAGRSEPWLAIDGGAGSGGSASSPGGGAAAGGAVGYVVFPPDDPLLDKGCSLAGLEEMWRLDEGWAALESRETIEEQTTARRSNGGAAWTGSGEDGRDAPLIPVAPGPGVVVLGREGRHTVGLPEDIGRGTPEQPLLVLVTGGADLDAEDLGDLYAVLVVDGGSIALDGTAVHGALFATGSVDVGGAGCLLFNRSILRWATDRSLQRARLVPGTRWEGME